MALDEYERRKRAFLAAAVDYGLAVRLCADDRADMREVSDAESRLETAARAYLGTTPTAKPPRHRHKQSRISSAPPTPGASGDKG